MLHPVASRALEEHRRALYEIYPDRHDRIDNWDLVDDEEDLILKAVGGWLRAAGKRDADRLLAFLDGWPGRVAGRGPRTRRSAPGGGSRGCWA